MTERLAVRMRRLCVREYIFVHVSMFQFFCVSVYVFCCVRLSLSVTSLHRLQRLCIS